MNRWSKIKLCLVSGLIPVLLFGAVGSLMPAKMTGALDWLSNGNGAASAKAIPSDYQTDQDKLVEMKLEKVIMVASQQGPVMLLSEKSGKRYLPISIGMSEARAIAIVLQGIKPARPLTSDLLRGVIDALGADVRFVLIEDQRDGVFYAKVILGVKDKTIEMDSRPRA